MKLVHGAEIAPGLRLVQPIGKGAMGSVWTADWDRRPEPVAVKLIPERIARVKGMIGRFKREAEVARRIQSHHVVEIYDLGETADGLPYIVMEKLDGETLEERLEREGIPSRSFVTRFVPQLGAALQAAHDVNVMHRDIKPSNLFLIGRGDSPMLKVLDFGAAKEVRVKGGSLVTATGVAIGSPFMMSPEQVLGSRYIDHRTDLWSFAVVLYRMLCGELPFVAENPSALAFTICQAKYHRPSELGAPPELDPWFAKALQPKKERRFESAREMARSFLEMLGENDAPAAGDDSSFHTAATGVFQGAATFAASHMPDPTGADDIEDPETDQRDTLTASVESPVVTPPQRSAQKTIQGHPPPPVREARTKERSQREDPELSASSSPPGDSSNATSDIHEEPTVDQAPAFPAPSVPPPPSDPEASAEEEESSAQGVSGQGVSSGQSVSPSAVSSKPTTESVAGKKSSSYVWVGVGLLAAAAIAVFVVRSGAKSEPLASAPTSTSRPAAVPSEPQPAAEPTASATAAAEVPEIPASAPSVSASATQEETPPEDSGQLTVICVPVCSDVRVDGESWGASPIEKRSVKAGFHSIMLLRGGMAAKPTTVKIEAGEHKEKKVFLEVAKPAPTPVASAPTSAPPRPAPPASPPPAAPPPAAPPPAAPPPPPPAAPPPAPPPVAPKSAPAPKPAPPPAPTP